jgi:Pseudouridylate synthases, 23S RNA-specific
MQKTNPRGRAAVVHRLDRDTSGVMLFAKNARVKKALMDNWNKLVRRRCYTALVEGLMPSETGTLDSWLIENRAGQVYETKPGTRGALRAITNWKIIAAAEGAPYSLVELELETGESTRFARSSPQSAILSRRCALRRTHGPGEPALPACAFARIRASLYAQSACV